MSKRLLKESLIELLNEKNLDKISITEVCVKADLNRSTFYQNYIDIIELYEDIEEDFLFNVPKYNRDSTTIELKEQYTKFISYLIKNKLLFNAIVKNSSIVDTLATISSNTQKDQVLGLFASPGFLAVLHKWINGELAMKEAEIVDYIVKIADALNKI